MIVGNSKPSQWGNRCSENLIGPQVSNDDPRTAVLLQPVVLRSAENRAAQGYAWTLGLNESDGITGVQTWEFLSFEIQKHRKSRLWIRKQGTRRLVHRIPRFLGMNWKRRASTLVERPGTVIA